jgi:hypothetical protein
MENVAREACLARSTLDPGLFEPVVERRFARLGVDLEHGFAPVFLNQVRAIR